VLNAAFKNISVMLGWSVLLMEVPRKSPQICCKYL